ncbi:MAG: hypothetical protein PHN38_10060 [Sulfurospirillaceae bacterium]|nr:hypothetical protein [Sulfurospirillaceae bacterium]MDD3463358.1 hypothetical protein [Sulfurospirillaceae bacterium]
MKKVLLLSAGSPCRAIVCEYLLKKETRDIAGIEFCGAGLEYGKTISKNAEKILTQEGINLEDIQPRYLKDVVDEEYDLVVTVCDYSKEISPVFPRAVRTLHMGFPSMSQENELMCSELVSRIKLKMKPFILKELGF